MPGSVHTIRMENGKANAIDGALLHAITRELDRAEQSGCSAVVLTGFSSFFSAGLNLKTLPQDEREMSSFVDELEEAFLKIVCFPLPVVAAVNGHAVAGGCVLASAADVRLGAEGDYQLGVSEVSLGIVFPATAFEIMRHTLPTERTADVLLGGRLLSPEEALSAGILHELVPAEDLLERAVARASELGAKPPRAFRHTKLALRAPMLERIERTRAEAKRGFLESWFSPEVVEKRKAMLSK